MVSLGTRVCCHPEASVIQLISNSKGLSLASSWSLCKLEEGGGGLGGGRRREREKEMTLQKPTYLRHLHVLIHYYYYYHHHHYYSHLGHLLHGLLHIRLGELELLNFCLGTLSSFAHCCTKVFLNKQKKG